MRWLLKNKREVFATFYMRHVRQDCWHSNNNKFTYVSLTNRKSKGHPDKVLNFSIQWPASGDGKTKSSAHCRFELFEYQSIEKRRVVTVLVGNSLGFKRSTDQKLSNRRWSGNLGLDALLDGIPNLWSVLLECMNIKWAWNGKLCSKIGQI